MNLPRFCVERPVTTLMIFFGVILIGVISLLRLPVDMFPEMTIPSLSVITRYPGASAEDVEAQVTEQLEDRLTTIPDLKHILSTSKQDLSVITLSFEWGTDLDTRANDVRDAIGFAEIVLPEDAEKPLVLKFDISNFPVMGFGVTAKESYPDLKEIAEDELADPLKRIPGVGSVIIRGAPRRQLNIDLDRQLLATHNITPQDVVRAIYNENQTNPAGNLKVGVKDYSIRVPGEFKQVEPMKRIVVSNQGGKIVRLEDVTSTVEYAFAEEKEPLRIDGQKGLVLMVLRQSGANTVQVARAVHKKIEALAGRLPDDVKVISVWDNSEDIVRMLRDLANTLWKGGLLTILVVLIFLRQARATFIIALSIPFSLILALIFTYVFGYTINMISLFGLVIAVGMVVDNSIVILENISRHREEGESRREGALYGSSEVALAVAASTYTTVVIFLPLIFVKGVIKILFTQFGVVLCVTILGSLFIAVTLTPMLSSKILPGAWDETRSRGIFRKLYQWSGRLLDPLYAAYNRALAWSLNHRKTVIALAVAIFGGSLFLMSFIGSEFTPDQDQGFVQGTVQLPVGTRVEETDRIMAEIEEIMKREIPPEELLVRYIRCGQSEEGIASVFGDEGPHIGEFGVKLVPKTERKEGFKDIAERLRRKIGQIPEIDKYRVETSDPMAGLLLGEERPVTVNVFGKDMDRTDAFAAEVETIFRSVRGTTDVDISRVKGNPELWVEIDRDKASSMGLNVSSISDTVRASFYGREASKYRIGGNEYDIFVRLHQKDRLTPDDIREMDIRLPTGESTQLANLATIVPRTGPVEIERKDRDRIVNVGSGVGNRSLGEIVAEVEKKVRGLERVPGVEWQMAGQAEEQKESFFWLRIAILIGAILVYMVMASQFESLLHPFVVMFSIPFAFIGVIWALFLGGFNLSIVVFIGVLLLIGIVVNNAIVLVDYTNILRARGLGIKEAAFQAGKTRVRPVLMTAITTIAGLLPMTFAKGQGSEMWNPLGATILGGLLVSTLVTLILVPTLYTIFEAKARPRSK